MKCSKTRTVKPALIVLLVALTLITPISAQPAAAATHFTPQDIFRIPELNGNINFAFDGSYTDAKLENNVWIFEGLELNNTEIVQQYGFTDFTPLRNLKVSAQNSNVTLLAFLSFNFSLQIEMVAFNVEGWGTQTINLGLNDTNTRSVAEWSIMTDNGATFLAEGSGWTLLDDNSIEIDYGPGNISVIHYYLTDPSMANLSFLAQHYVTLLTGAVLAATLAIATAITFRHRRKNKLVVSVK